MKLMKYTYWKKNGEKKQKNDFVKIHETDKNGISLQCTSRRSKILEKELQKIGKNEISIGFDNNEIYEYYNLSTKFTYPTSSGSNVNIENSLILELSKSITSSKQKMIDLIKLVYNNFIHSLQDFENEFLNINN